MCSPYRSSASNLPHYSRNLVLERRNNAVAHGYQKSPLSTASGRDQCCMRGRGTAMLSLLPSALRLITKIVSPRVLEVGRGTRPTVTRTGPTKLQQRSKSVSDTSNRFASRTLAIGVRHKIASLLNRPRPSKPILPNDHMGHLDRFDPCLAVVENTSSSGDPPHQSGLGDDR